MLAEQYALAARQTKKPALLAAIPHRTYGRLRPTWSETTTIPATTIKARPSGTVILRSVKVIMVLSALPRDDIGWSIAGQEAITMPMTRYAVFGYAILILAGRG
jgi:hypothetical protein